MGFEDQLNGSNSLDHSYHDLQQGSSWMDHSSPHAEDGFSPLSQFSQGSSNLYQESPNVQNSSIFQEFIPSSSMRGVEVDYIKPVRSPSNRPKSWSGRENTLEVARTRVTSVHAFSSAFQISIPSCGTEQDGEGCFVAYRIIVKSAYSKVEVKRRYRHFSQLHQDLSHVEGIQLPPFPAKRRTSTAAEAYSAHDQMRISLQKYLQMLGSAPKIWRYPYLIDFLDFRHPVLGLQVQVTLLSDDLTNMHDENAYLRRQYNQIHQTIEGMADAMTSMRRQVSLLTEQQEVYKGSLPHGVPNSFVSDQVNSPGKHFSHTTRTTQGRTESAIAYSNQINEGSSYSNNYASPNASSQYDTTSWSPTNNDMDSTNYSAPVMRMPDSRPDILIQQSSLSSKSLQEDTSSQQSPPRSSNTLTELKDSVDISDQERFANFFGIGIDDITSETEASLQQLPSSLNEPSLETPEQNSQLTSNAENNSGKVSFITSLIKPAGSNRFISAYLHSDVINEAILDPELLDFSNDIVQMILPTKDQLLYRHNIEKYISKLVRKSLGAQLYQTGLNSLRCFLPDDSISLSVYLCRGLEHSWYVRLNEKLSRMSNGAISTTEPDEEADVDGDVQVDGDGNEKSNVTTPSSSPLRSNEKNSPTQTPSDNNQVQHSGSSSHPIRNVSVISNDEESVLQCDVGCTTVKIRANMKLDLCFAAFLEEIDQNVQRNHLFKKSLNLVRAWWLYESPKYSSGEFDPTMVSKTALCIMVCAIFNLYGNSITSPIHVLMLFLAEYSDFDWNIYALTIFGRVRRNLIEALPYSTFVKKNGSLFSAPIIQRYQKIFHGTSNDILNQPHADNITIDQSPPKSAIFTLFERIEENENESNTTLENAEYVGCSEIKIFHPLEPNVNVIPEKVSSSDIQTLLGVVQGGASRMNDILKFNCEGSLCSNMKDFFSVTIERFVNGWRPDVVQKPPSSVMQKEQISDVLNNTGDIENKEASKPSGIADTIFARSTDGSDEDFFNEVGEDPLLISIDVLADRIKHCNFLLEAQVTEPVLQRLSKEILQERGPLPVGEIGKMLQEITSISTLSAYLKEKYGGLKKFLEMFEGDFVISVDHPFNPHVFLRHGLMPEDIAAINDGSIPLHLSTKANKRRLSRRKRLSSQGSTTTSDRSSPSPHQYGIERSHSMNSYERSNSYHSRNSFSSQHSYGHSSSNSPSPSPPPTFYGYSGASRSYSPPPSQGQYIPNQRHRPSNNQGERRRGTNNNDGRRDRNYGDRDDNLDYQANRRTIPNPSFRRDYQPELNNERFQDSGGTYKTSSRVPPPPGLYASFDGNYRAGR